MTKPRLTLLEHATLGERLAAMRDELLHLHVLLDNAYPKTGHEGAPARSLEKAQRAIDDARTHLDHAVFREYPRHASTALYYPHREDRAAVD
ncbi:hypothetical protein [Streptomyces sp. ISL-100]|uniref:hypothetical protein n=1 Tax=Streptomyces sp. ISL-100 TaxID=2819173 RepID=UPI001BEA8561|nr:hypothetical protein [Streptomyces sp. ISL-100]MBT2401507.1 hypothetical protein [Streptomyces sp. ISL-100]